MIDVLNGDTAAARRRIQAATADSSQEGFQGAADVALMLHDVRAARAGYERTIDAAARAIAPPQSSTGRGVKRFSVVDSWYLSTSLAYTLLEAGDSARALELLDEAAAIDREELEAGNESGPIRYDLAVISAMRGNTAEALEWLEAAIEAGYRLYPALLLDPRIDRLREEPPFRQLIERVRQDVDSMRQNQGRSSR